ncbi:PREDICTED: CMRF35-like molecule 7 [Calidris pugnax]|uniref:CMRF35-like molecule 7 n=1 Tax=Calidris pugnax TaxID=198806 RepID=UPI00071C4121|nr:PREDICTED: CMRF35-like molecule 7 [Calidris pugnax]
MRIFLVWTVYPVWTLFPVWSLFPGGWAVTGPKEVTAKQGSSLEVSCSYKPGYELYPKYWCRPGFLWFCFTYIAQTNGSEVTVTQGRVSIRDNHTSRSFVVTLSGVTTEDADWYSCGVKRTLWFNLQHSMEVMVSPGKAGPGAKQGHGIEPITWVTELGTGPSQPGEHRAVPTTTKASDMLTTEPLGSTGCEQLSQLVITHLLLFLSVKVPVVLALACGVVDHLTEGDAGTDLCGVQTGKTQSNNKSVKVKVILSPGQSSRLPICPTNQQ